MNKTEFLSKRERDEMREDACKYFGGPAGIAEKVVKLIDHIDALEANDIRLRNLITRAIGWVEEVKCISEQAVLEQRSFITELEVAALTKAEEKGE